MGTVKREELLYLNVSKGKLVNKQKNIEANAYEGTLVGIREREGKFEEQKTLKIELKMKDTQSDEHAIIQFTKEAFYSLGFFARIRKIDISKPFTVGVLPSEMNEKMSFCYLKQPPVQKIESDKSFPKPKKVMLNKKEVLDWSACFDEMDSIMKFLNEKLSENDRILVPENVAKEAIPISKTDEDLPF